MSSRLLVLAAATVFGVAGAAHAQVLTQWNFNGDSATTVPGGTTSPTPSVGSGTAALRGGTTATFASGVANGGSTDPVTTAPPNYGWNLTTFAAQGAENGLRGAQFNVSTVGVLGGTLVVSWDHRHSNTSSRFVQFQYSTDGSSFTDFGTPFEGTAGDTWFNNRSVDLTGLSGVYNNANFAFRIVAVFDPQGSGYVASNSTGTYAGSGTWRLDMVTISVPEPSAVALLGLGGLAALRRRRA